MSTQEPLFIIELFLSHQVAFIIFMIEKIQQLKNDKTEKFNIAHSSLSDDGFLCSVQETISQS